MPSHRIRVLAAAATLALFLASPLTLSAAERSTLVAASTMEKLKEGLKKALATPPAQPGAPAAAQGTAGSSEWAVDRSGYPTPAPKFTPVPKGYVAPPWADRLDIVGIKVGMPAEQAVRLLRKQNPDFAMHQEHIEFANLDESSTWLVWGQQSSTSGSQMEEIDVGLALPPHPSVVNEIIRYVLFPAGEQPTIASVLESLSTKYGVPLLPLQRNPYVYVARLDGQKVVQPGNGGCYYDLDPTEPMRRQTSIKDNWTLQTTIRDIEKNGRYADACGVLVVAQIVPVHTNEQLASQLYIRVCSEPYRFGQLQKTGAYLASLDQARKDKEAAAAKKVQVKY